RGKKRERERERQIKGERDGDRGRVDQWSLRQSQARGLHIKPQCVRAPVSGNRTCISHTHTHTLVQLSQGMRMHHSKHPASPPQSFIPHIQKGCAINQRLPNMVRNVHLVCACVCI